jgi:hypothetical protein
VVWCLSTRTTLPLRVRVCYSCRWRREHWGKETEEIAYSGTSPNNIRIIKSCVMEWAGHAAHMHSLSDRLKVKGIRRVPKYSWKGG